MYGTTSATANLADGSRLAERYRILHRAGRGWLAYDERLRRSVLIETILGSGAPAERVRREASNDIPLLDALVCGDTAFAVRVISSRL